MAMPLPFSVITGIGFLNSSIATLPARKPLFKPTDFAIELLLGLWVNPAVAQFLLSLSDLDLPLKMRILWFHCFSFRFASIWRRYMSRREGREPFGDGACANERGAAADSAPDTLLAVLLYWFFAFILL